MHLAINKYFTHKLGQIEGGVIAAMLLSLAIGK
jgi:hypothetical protein